MARHGNKIHFVQSEALVKHLYDLAVTGCSLPVQRIIAICLEHELIDSRDKEESKEWRSLTRNTATGKKAQEFVDEFEGVIPRVETGIIRRPPVCNVRRLPGIPSAAFKAGLAFFNRRDYERAIHWLGRGLEQGGTEASFYLAFCHLFGLGTEQNFQKAFEYFPEKEREEMPFLKTFVYEEQLKDVFKKQDRLDSLVQRAEEGELEAQVSLAAAYETGSLGRKDEKQALKWYEAAAGKNHVEALIKLGEWYGRAENRTSYPGEALRLFKRAAELNNRRAQCWMGDYYSGLTNPSDKANALKWYGKAARNNDHRAQYRLALLSEKSPDAKIKEAASYWYYRALPYIQEAREALLKMFPIERREALQLSATWGDGDALLNLGICYAGGIGCAVNKAEAGKCFKAAAKGGLVLAESALQEWENLSGVISLKTPPSLLSRKKAKRKIVHYDPNEVDDEEV